MAIDIAQLINSGSVGVQVQSITGSIEDSAYATGYAAWITAITGAPPKIVKVADGRAKFVLSEAQNITMRQWLSSQTQGILQTGAPPKVDYSAGDYLTPWAIQYAVPAVIVAFVAGWVAHWYFNK